MNNGCIHYGSYVIIIGLGGQMLLWLWKIFKHYGHNKISLPWPLILIYNYNEENHYPLHTKNNHFSSLARSKHPQNINIYIDILFEAFKPLIIIAKRSILNVRQDSRYVSDERESTKFIQNLMRAVVHFRSFRKRA